MASIRPLDTGTAKTLSSAQVITSPFSAVKELLENSLDARATIISIEISANTIDLVQVRDNGHGIAPKDRGICCRRHTTSKLMDLAELNTIGGKSLGFRGEALFALAQVVGKMEVTTRVDGESVAVKLGIDSNGEVTGRSTASHQIGTTVCVADFFNRIPVRKQTTVRHASKCIAKTRKLLQAYALARPNVRFNMRVVKAKNDKSNFSYGPKMGDATVQDAAFKVVGMEAASQCAWSVLEAGGYEVQALLPTPDTICNRINHVGHFISIDHRPVSTSRGFLKQISKRIIEKMRSSSEDLRSVKDPFFVLNIVCPEGSYDPNIEPAKDDVIFDNSSDALHAVDELLSVIYPDQPSRSLHKELPLSTTSEDSTETEAATTREHAPLIGPRSVTEGESRSDQPEDTDLVGEDILTSTNELDILTSRANIWRPSMYGCDEDDLAPFEREEPTHTTDIEVEDKMDKREGLNPWTIAKMNATIKPTAAVVHHSIQPPQPRAFTLSPEPTYQHNVGLRRRSVDYELDNDTSLRSQPRPTQARDGSSILDAPTFHQAHHSQFGLECLPTPPTSSSPIRGSSQMLHEAKVKQQKQARRNQFVNKAFIQPRHQGDASAGPGLERTAMPRAPRAHRNANQDTRQTRLDPTGPHQEIALVSQGEPTDDLPSSAQIEEDFRARLRRAGEDLSSQYSRRVLAASPEAEKPSHTPIIQHSQWTPINNVHHPLSEEMQKTMTKRRRTTESKRTKSSRLPLERIPEGYHTQHVVQYISLSPSKLESSICHLECDLATPKYADAVRTQDQNLAESLPSATLVHLSLKAAELLQQRVREAESANNNECTAALQEALTSLERYDEVEIAQ